MAKATRQRNRSPLHGVNWPHPSQEDLLLAAREYVDKGLSLIPIGDDGSKMPAFPFLPRYWHESQERYKRKWSVFRERLPTEKELSSWFAMEWPLEELGFAVLGGSISGGLEIIDLDNEDIVGPWSERVEQLSPGLLDRLVRVRTPRPGMHAYYRCEAFGGNQKLARVPDETSIDTKTGKPKPKTLIEVKGEGGYCLAPPSPPACHSRNVSYRFIGSRDLTQIERITAAERQLLFDAAKELNQWNDPRLLIPRRRSPGVRRDRPGDDFDSRGDWSELLQRHGWRPVTFSVEGVVHWCRPGKLGPGTSATVNYENSNLLYVFSTSADPFECETAYTKFHAYSLLEHDGDFRAAARELARQGYGRRRSQRGGRAKVGARHRHLPLARNRYRSRWRR